MTKVLIVVLAFITAALAEKIDPFLNWKILGGSDAPDDKYPFMVKLTVSMVWVQILFLLWLDLIGSITLVICTWLTQSKFIRVGIQTSGLTIWPFLD